jgi:hypothetical protein
MYAATGESHSFDFRAGSDQEHIITQFSEWAKEIKCQNGTQVGHSCRCDTLSFGGPKCSDPKHEQRSFEEISLCAVLVTTVLLLIIGASVWLCGKREDEEYGQYHGRLATMHAYT